MNRQGALVVGLLVFTALTLVRPPYPQDQVLQHAPLVVVAPLLVVAARRRWLGDLAFTCVIAFLALHAIGARWVYSMVPYDAWCRELLGFSPCVRFGLSRNHYDRFVHAAFGVLAVPVIADIAERRAGVSRGVAVLVAFLFVGALSAVYEVFEWGLTMTAAPDMADRYNGQQGDMWDAQKDMALALLGAVPPSLWLLFPRRPD